MPEFVDAGPSQVGTPLASSTLDTLVVAQTYIVTGAAPAAAATLAQPFPSVGVVFNNGAGIATYTAIAAATLSLTASADNYIDATQAGAYAAPLAVGHGAAPPAVAPGNLRVFLAVTAAGSVSSVALIGPTQPLNATQVQNAVQLNPTGPQSGSVAVTGTVAAGSDVTTGGGASLTTASSTAINAQSSAGAANTAASNAQSAANAAQSSANSAQSVANGAQTSANNAQSAAHAAQTSATNAQSTASAAIPSTERGAASGVPTLDASTRVVQPPPVGFYRNVVYQQNTTQMYFGGGTTSGTFPWTALPNTTNFSPSTAPTRGGTLKVSLNGHAGPTFGNTGDNAQAQWRVNIDAGARYVYLGMVEALCRQMAADLGLVAYATGLAAGTHTFILECQTFGASTMQWQCLTGTSPNGDQLVFTIDEF